MKTKNTPLVSIIVVTYNSDRYVLETLESIYAQTYQNLELIVADDYSTDQTIELCEHWLNSNCHRFAAIKIIKTEKNSGTAGNCNRGVRAATGTWIKIIAGDDALEPEMITTYIDFIDHNRDVKCVYSNVREYNNVFNDAYALPLRNLKDLMINQADCTASEQFNLLLRLNPVWASTIMTRKDILNSIGMFNEKYELFEDRPMLLALTGAGHKIYYIDTIGAKYRRHTESVQVAKKTVFMSRFKQNQEDFFMHECLKYFEPQEQWVIRYRYRKNLMLKNVFNNTNNLCVKGLSRLFELIPTIYLKLNYKRK